MRSKRLLESAALLCIAIPVAKAQYAATGPVQLDLTPPQGFEKRSTGEGPLTFAGELDGAQVQITLILHKRGDDVVVEDVVWWVARGDTFREQDYDTEYVSGPVGELPYAALLRARSDDAETWALCGVTANRAYELRAHCKPALGKKGEKQLRTFFEQGVRYGGPTIDPVWTDEEARARWQEHTPEDLHGKLRIQRTKHYLILTNASGGALFGKKMEECYREIQKVFPFPEVEGRRLMPVFLFRLPDEYYDYYMRVAGRDREQAERSKGHAWRDYYATYYEAPNDPIHIHEATHQIFSNRLRLGGGGSWFQEGVADYLSERANTIKASVKNQIKADAHMPLKKLIVVPSLLGSIDGDSVRGGSNSGNAYLQAASIIAFLRESRFGKKHFLDFVHAVGKVQRGDLKAIEAAVQEIYQVDLDELEERWMKHWGR